LTVAAHQGHANVARMLLAAGASTHDRRTDGFDAMLLAASEGHEEVVDVLLRARAATETREVATGATPLILAAQNGHAAIVELLAAVADTEAKRRDGMTALMLASFNGHTANVRGLLHAGARPEAQRAAGGSSAVDFARRRGHTECAALLLRAEVHRRPKLHLVLRASDEEDGYETADEVEDKADSQRAVVTKSGQRTNEARAATHCLAWLAARASHSLAGQDRAVSCEDSEKQESTGEGSPPDGYESADDASCDNG